MRVVSAFASRTCPRDVTRRDTIVDLDHNARGSHTFNLEREDPNSSDLNSSNLGIVKASATLTPVKDYGATNDDSNGLAIKFFIQKDLSQDLQAELCETITALGGRVEAKVPRQGYILVNPNTPEEERLRLCWTSADRPERYFVPYTFVEACKISGMLLKQLFIENNAPIPMHIHSSIANINARSALSARIRHSGGDPTASIATARVILADPHTEVFHHLVQTYQSDPNKYIESYLWIKKCIERGIMTYTPVVYKNPGGRRPGEDRTLFTEEDEHNLCVYIAAKIPFKETGGRTGNRIYTQLCDMKDDPEYAWVQRHTWQSWRERYKKNSERLDKLIATIVAQTNPAHGEKGQYGYVRQPEEKPKKSRRRPAKESPPTDDEQSDTGRSPVAGPSKRPEKNVDEDDESEWAVRVGTSPPPAWAGEKRKANGNDETLPAKRSKSNVRIDEEIANIAREYMFTTEEVRTHFSSSRDLERTRDRFKGMRELLSTNFSP